MKNRLLHRNFLVILAVDALLLSAAWYSAWLLRFNFEIPAENIGLLIRVLPLVVVIKILIFSFFDLYSIRACGAIRALAISSISLRAPV